MSLTQDLHRDRWPKLDVDWPVMAQASSQRRHDVPRLVPQYQMTDSRAHSPSHAIETAVRHGVGGEIPTVTSKGLPDLLAPGMDIVFCGINPGSRAAASGHHFDGRGNRFWRVMHLAGFTPDLMTPAQDRLLMAFGYGLTTAVDRCTSRASQVETHEFVAAAEEFTRKMTAYRPHRLAFLGKSAYAAMTGQKRIDWGRQTALFADIETWILPNPSGLNRAFSLDDLVDAYSALRVATRSANSTE